MRNGKREAQMRTNGKREARMRNGKREAQMRANVETRNGKRECTSGPPYKSDLTNGDCQVMAPLLLEMGPIGKTSNWKSVYKRGIVFFCSLPEYREPT